MLVELRVGIEAETGSPTMIEEAMLLDVMVGGVLDMVKRWALVCRGQSNVSFNDPRRGPFNESAQLVVTS